MADKKITALSDLGSDVHKDDLFHLIDDPGGTPVNKKVSVANLFNNFPTWLAFDSTPEAVTAAGALAVADTASYGAAVSTISTSAPIALTLPNGSTGQIKILVMIADSGDATLTVDSPGILGYSSNQVVFGDVGDTVTMMFLDTTNGWVVLANDGAAIT
jgi:hypothetical protein